MHFVDCTGIPRTAEGILQSIPLIKMKRSFSHQDYTIPIWICVQFPWQDNQQDKAREAAEANARRARGSESSYRRRKCKCICSNFRLSSCGHTIHSHLWQSSTRSKFRSCKRLCKYWSHKGKSSSTAPLIFVLVKPLLLFWEPWPSLDLGDKMTYLNNNYLVVTESNLSDSMKTKLVPFWQYSEQYSEDSMNGMVCQCIIATVLMQSDPTLTYKVRLVNLTPCVIIAPCAKIMI